MALSSAPSSYQWPNLSQDQQDLLLAALSSNKRSQPTRNGDTQNMNPSTSLHSLDATSDTGLFNPSVNQGVDIASLDSAAFDASFLDPSTFDLSVAPNDFLDPYQHADYHSEDEGEVHEKRKSPTDDEDDENDHKRHELDDKTAKKPGRKPLTSEPTTKRKAQNRAAQRAFRERKEKHLKDLEQKVTDLERVSESANHENGLLRAQVERLQAELVEYRKRMSASNAVNASPPLRPFAGNTINTDFTFDFPKFQSDVSPTAQSKLPTTVRKPSETQSNSSPTTSIIPPAIQDQSQSIDPRTADLFSPIVVKAESPEDYSSLGLNQTEDQSQGRKGTSLSTHSASISGTSHTTSPTSSTTQRGPASSCSTSPEPAIALKSAFPAAADYLSLNAFSPSLPSNTMKTPGLEPFSFDWFANQNDGQFNPELFDGYRDSQDAIVGDGDFTGGLYDDSFNFPLTNAFGTTVDVTGNNTSAASTVEASNPKLAQVLNPVEHADRICSGEQRRQPSLYELATQPMLTAHTIWKEIETCPKYKAGELDIDSLCSELAAKACCTETGMAVPKENFEAALWRLVGDDAKAKSMEKPPRRL